MKQLKYIWLIIILAVASQLKAQQDPMFTQYMHNMNTINPAYAGSKGVLSATLLGRMQWVNFGTGVQTQNLFVHSPIPEKDMGLGVTIMHDKTAYEDNTSLFFDYSYTLFFEGQERSLSFGLKGGASFYSAPLSGLDLYYPGMEEIPDPAFLNDVSRPLLPNAGVGVYYFTPKYYLGLSAPKLIKNVINEDDFLSGHASREEIHIFFMGGYVFDVNRILKFKPYFMAKMVKDAPISFDLTAQLIFLNDYWVGANYRFGESLGAMLRVQVSKQLSIGYAYEYPLSELGAYNSGTHEVMISFDFDFGSNRIHSPRYF